MRPDRRITTNNMLYHTLAPMYRGTYLNRVAFMVFDEAETVGDFQGSKSRGIFMADEIGGIFIGHNVQNLIEHNNLDRPKFPEEELINGHLLMCISMDVDTLNEIATLVRYIGAKITILQVPKHMEAIIPSWVDDQWDSGIRIGHTDLTWHKQSYGPLEFISRQSALHVMVLYRKPGENICLYEAFAKRQGIVLDVYSPNGKRQKNVCTKNYGVRSISSISLKIRDEIVQYVNNRTDKTRFAVSTAASWQKKGRGKTQYWTCMSSLDRSDTSKKGGILTCINNYEVWLAFDNLKVKEPDCK